MVWYVYIMVNTPNGILYIGFTHNIQQRVKEHKLKKYPNSFTAKYNCDKLIYLEDFNDGSLAKVREDQLKKWKRDWKIQLIEVQNPSWMDISLNWEFDLRKFRDET